MLTLGDLSPAELRYVLRLGAELKAAKQAGQEVQRLRGKNIALIFEKDSARTRTGFEVVAYDQGACASSRTSTSEHVRDLRR